MELTNEEVHRMSKLAQRRYAALEPTETMTTIAYEVQGFVADAVARGRPLEQALGCIAELLIMIKQRNLHHG